MSLIQSLNHGHNPSEAHLTFHRKCKSLMTWRIHLKDYKQEGHDGRVLLHWLICTIPSYQTLKYFGIRLKRKTPKKD